MRVLIAVTHLLGAGHLTRAAALARAFAAQGHLTTLVSGGRPAMLEDLDGVTLVQLPAVHIRGTDFKTLLDDAGEPMSAKMLGERRERLLQTLHGAKPDILITELFPFGRRVLADEFMALLDEARRLAPRPLILSSIRDILVSPARPERIAETHERLLRFYDGVLIHGDPALVALDASWPLDERIAPLLHDTGYVDENPAPVPERMREGIVVSGGSSAASLPLYRAAIEAARTIKEKPWRILVGRGVGEAAFQELRAQAPAHVTVERARRDFRALLAGAEVSVSQAGYNTAVDLLRTGVRAVLVPFEAGNETEQRLRAERLARLGLAEIVPENDLSPALLADAVRRALEAKPLLSAPQGKGDRGISGSLSDAGAHTPAPPPARKGEGMHARFIRSAATPPTFALDGARRSVAIATALAQGAPSLHRRIDWSPLSESLERAQERDTPMAFWWRDDDAVADTPALNRLLSLSRRFSAPLALACIPAQLEASLAQRLAGEPLAFALVHGWRHANHAPAPEKKAEFGAHRALDVMEAEAAAALEHARSALGSKLLPVFVPPWNRMTPALAPALPRLGYGGLSTFGNRNPAGSTRGLATVNTHIDPIDWHGTRSLAAPETVVAALARSVDQRASGQADADEPIGFLTHHLIHDEMVWPFCAALLDYLTSRRVPILAADALFCNGGRIMTMA